MKLNKKGFAISSIIYSILILFLLLIFGILSILGSRKLIFDKMKNDVMNKLNGDVVVKEPELQPNLAQELISQYSESNTVGLLKDETGYYYKGTKEEVANNFVWFGGHLWRVISIDNDNNLTMITQQPLTAINFASSVWTTEQAYNQSYVNQWLNEVFLGSMEEDDKANIQYNTFNVGGTYNLTTQVASNIDNITTTQKAGLLDSDQYTRAGGKNSYLDINSRFWLGNRRDTSYILFIDPYSTKIGDRLPTVPLGIRPVIKVSNLVFTEGNGTLENPFYNKNTVKTINSIKVGEYISVPTNGTDCGEDQRCLFRVVSKDNDSVKIILNGILPNTSSTTVTYTKESTIDAIVTSFANTIDNRYRYTGNKVFNIGVYGIGMNYTAVQNQTYNGNVGLPVAGEIFSENDIDVSTSTIKYFVNSNTIENPTISNYFWTMNAVSDINVRYVEDTNGYSTATSNINNSYGVRPVLFLNKNLNFTSGEGTAENPFTLE